MFFSLGMSLHKIRNRNSKNKNDVKASFSTDFVHVLLSVSLEYIVCNGYLLTFFSGRQSFLIKNFLCALFNVRATRLSLIYASETHSIWMKHILKMEYTKCIHKHLNREKSVDCLHWGHSVKVLRRIQSTSVFLLRFNFSYFFLVCKATLTHRSQSMLKSDTRYIGNDNDDGDGDEEEEAMGAIKVRTLAA